MLHQIPQGVQTVITGGAVGSTIATYIGWLPDIAGGFAILWFVLLIIEWLVNKKWQKKDK